MRCDADDSSPLHTLRDLFLPCARSHSSHDLRHRRQTTNLAVAKALLCGFGVQLVAFFANMDPEIRLVLVISLLEVSQGTDALEADLE